MAFFFQYLSCKFVFLQSQTSGYLMKMDPLPTAGAVALLLVYLMVAHDKEKKRSTSRFRVSGKTFRRISCRAALANDFFVDFLNALLRLGYVGFVFEGGIGVIEATAVSGWSQISSKRVKARLDQFEAENFDDLEMVQETVDNYFTNKVKFAKGW
jgi:hypothetical protein